MKPAPDIPTSTKPAQKKKNSKAKKEEAGISQTDLGEFLSQISPLYSLAKYYLENKSKFAFLKNPVMIFKAAQLTDCVHKAMEFMQKAGLLPFKQEALKTIPQQQFLTLRSNLTTASIQDFVPSKGRTYLKQQQMNSIWNLWTRETVSGVEDILALLKWWCSPAILEQQDWSIKFQLNLIKRHQIRPANPPKVPPSTEDIVVLDEDLDQERRTWRTTEMSLLKQILDLKKENKRLEKENEDLEEERNRLKIDKDHLEESKGQLTAELEQASSKLIPATDLEAMLKRCIDRMIPSRSPERARHQRSRTPDNKRARR